MEYYVTNFRIKFLSILLSGKYPLNELKYARVTTLSIDAFDK